VCESMRRLCDVQLVPGGGLRVTASNARAKAADKVPDCHSGASPGPPNNRGVRVPTYASSDTWNDTCIAQSGRMQRHLYFDLLGLSAWSLLASVAGIAGHQYDTVF
jgi:hypothetical protein